MTLPPPGFPEHLPVESAAFFVYGPLAFPEVMQVLLARVPVSFIASAAGWRVVTTQWLTQAVLVRAEAVAHGSVVVDLSNAEWQLLDAFQVGCELQLLDLADGSTAWTHVCVDQRQVSAEDWDIAQFERDGLVPYLKNCAEWRRQHQIDTSGR